MLKVSVATVAHRGVKQCDTKSLKVGDQVKNFSEIKKGDEVFVRDTQATEISVHTP